MTPSVDLCRLGMLLQLEWKYLQNNVPKVGTLMGHIEEALKMKFLLALFGGEDINTNFCQILGHIVKHGDLGIPDPWFSAESLYSTSKVDSGELVGYLLGSNSLNYVGHIACVRESSAGVRKDQKYIEMGELARQKDLEGVQ